MKNKKFEGYVRATLKAHGKELVYIRTNVDKLIWRVAGISAVVSITIGVVL